MYDWTAMAAVAAELRAEALGARVERIYQHERLEVLLHLHRGGRRFALLLSAHPDLSRVHLTTREYRNPPHPPPFCMLLRKYLIGGRLESLRQQAGERFLELSFTPPEGRRPVTLVAEIMGRRSNVLLLDEKRVILGAVRLVSAERNRYRTVLTGETYQPPPPQEKLDPLAADPAVLVRALRERFRAGVKPEQALQETVRGASSLLARELIHRSTAGEINPEAALGRLALETRTLFQEIAAGRFSPEAAWEEALFAAYPLTFIPEERLERFRSMNELLDCFFGRVVQAGEEEKLRLSLLTPVRQKLARTRRRKEQQEADLARAARGEEHRLSGELILACLNRIPPRAGRVELPDPYRPGETVTVELNPALSPSANAQRHFRLYQKAKSGLEQAGRQLEQTREEILYLEELLYAVENGDRDTLAEIRSELVELGMLQAERHAREQGGGKAGKKGRAGKSREKDLPPETRPLQFLSTGGHTILVGRNNRQNERLTFNTASRRDLWLHARELPGSHVLVRDLPAPPPEADLEEAALLAAYFSKGRLSSAVAVDYTEARFVRRAPGGRPGRVLYTNYGTITVNPADQRLQALLKNFGTQ